MGKTIPYNCKDCGTKNPEDFRGNAKSVCSKCRGKRNTLRCNTIEGRKKKAEYNKKYNKKQNQNQIKRFNIVFTDYPVVLTW